MSRLPREAREGLLRAWLEILRERHPGTTWVPALQEQCDRTQPTVCKAPVGASGWGGAKERALPEAA